MKIKQTTVGLDPYIRKYGCYFMSLANSVGVEFSVDDINKMWAKCIKLGYISGDMNNDGDFDDYNELLIMDPNGVCGILGSHYRYLDKHYDPTSTILDGYYAVGCFLNPKNKFRHFVVIDKNKKVIYDPIPNSLTVRNGYLESMRLYKPV